MTSITRKLMEKIAPHIKTNPIARIFFVEACINDSIYDAKIERDADWREAIYKKFNLCTDTSDKISASELMSEIKPVKIYNEDS